MKLMDLPEWHLTSENHWTQDDFPGCTIIVKPPNKKGNKQFIL